MRVTISPSIPWGTVSAPPSKSMAHRMLICAGLAHKLEPCMIFGLEESQDVLATIDCLNVLGAGVNRQKDCAIVYGIDRSAIQANDTLPCRECGSTLRFFVPLCLLSDKPLTLTGSPTLMSRPMSVYQDVCRRQGLAFSQDEQGIHVRGPLHADTFAIPGNISSQFISGLLFALPLLDGDSTIQLLPPVESRPYINMTIEALSRFGVQASWENDTTIRVRGGQRYKNISIHVEGDYSNAAFLEALNYLGNYTACARHGHASTRLATRAAGATANAHDLTRMRADVHVSGLRENSLQGDSAYKSLFPTLVKTTPVISLAHCPDLGPVLMAVAAANHGATFTDCKRLAIKESNRGQAMAQELEKFGITVSISSDDDIIVVYPGTLRPPCEPLDGHNDHRIVMALCTLACAVGGTVEGAQAVRKSFPSYFERLRQLGVEFHMEDEHEMD